jgi:hypothetical protein
LGDGLLSHVQARQRHYIVTRTAPDPRPTKPDAPVIADHINDRDFRSLDDGAVSNDSKTR